MSFLWYPFKTECGCLTPLSRCFTSTKSQNCADLPIQPDLMGKRRNSTTFTDNSACHANAFTAYFTSFMRHGVNIVKQLFAYQLT